MELANITKLIAALFVCQLAGAIGTVFAVSSIQTWYASLQKPWFNPPNWLFGPAWLTLYFLMGISLYLVWAKGREKGAVKTAMLVFGMQLVLNALWSIIFFGLKSPFYAFIEIVFLWIVILATIVTFHPISKKASLLLLPYIAWVSFAAMLNFSVWMLNP